MYALYLWWPYFLNKTLSTYKNLGRLFEITVSWKTDVYFFLCPSAIKYSILVTIDGAEIKDTKWSQVRYKWRTLMFFAVSSTDEHYPNVLSLCMRKDVMISKKKRNVWEGKKVKEGSNSKRYYKKVISYEILYKDSIKRWDLVFQKGRNQRGFTAVCKNVDWVKWICLQNSRIFHRAIYFYTPRLQGK